MTLRRSTAPFLLDYYTVLQKEPKLAWALLRMLQFDRKSSRASRLVLQYSIARPVESDIIFFPPDTEVMVQPRHIVLGFLLRLVHHDIPCIKFSEVFWLSYVV